MNLSSDKTDQTRFFILIRLDKLDKTNKTPQIKGGINSF